MLLSREAGPAREKGQKEHSPQKPCQAGGNPKAQMEREWGGWFRGCMEPFFPKSACPNPLCASSHSGGPRGQTCIPSFASVGPDTHMALPQPLQEHPCDPAPPPHPPLALFPQQPAQIPHPTSPILPSQTNLHTRSTAFHPEQPSLVSFLLIQSPARSVPPPAYWTSLCRLLHSYPSWRPTFSQHLEVSLHTQLRREMPRKEAAALKQSSRPA